MRRTGIESIDRYVKGIRDGSIPVCKLVRQCVDRHVSDLDKAATAKWPYYFNAGAAQHAISYFDNLRHWKGKWAGTRIHLEDWQTFVIGSMFGWLKKKDHLRRFRESYIEVPRKNGKTTTLAGIGLYGIDYDGEPGAEVYCAATSRAQASIVFDDAMNMVMFNSKLKREIAISKTALASTRTNSSFKSLSKEHKRLDGLNTHFGLFDELHAWEKRELYDVIDTSTGAREQPMLISITTAGANTEGIAYEIRGYLLKILEGVVEDDRFWGIVYSIDKGDEERWDQPDVWAKANPNYRVSIFEEDLKALAAKARESEAMKNGFLTKRLNVWVSSFSSWLDMARFRACESPELSLDHYRGKACYIALDLSSKLDLASYVLLFRDDDGKLVAFSRNYLPAKTVERDLVGRRSVYRGWATANRITLHEGEVIDYSSILDDIMADCKAFNVQRVGYDPFQATFLVQELQRAKINVVEVRQTVTQLSEPMKELEARIVNKTIRFPDDPVMRWCMSNITAKEDKKGNIYPNKAHKDAKIDAGVALIMAQAMHLAAPLGKTTTKRKPRVWVV